MDTTSEDYFWPSYLDLMMSLFFVVLVLFVMSFTLFNKKKSELEATVADARRLKEIRENLNILMSDSLFFIYKPEYKRYMLNTNVKFEKQKSRFVRGELKDYNETTSKLSDTGKKLYSIIELLQAKKENPNYADVSYMLVIEGRASDLKKGRQSDDYVLYNYDLSYQRAFNLYNFWKKQGYDFGDKRFHNIIDLQISGSGTGGIGRYKGSFKEESKNQSFIIHIIPKIGT